VLKLHLYQYFTGNICVSKGLFTTALAMTGTNLKKLRLFLLLITLPALVLMLATYLYKLNGTDRQVSAKSVSESHR
jgi:hypothetical protein